MRPLYSKRSLTLLTLPLLAYSCLGSLLSVVPSSYSFRSPTSPSLSSGAFRTTLGADNARRDIRQPRQNSDLERPNTEHSLTLRLSYNTTPVFASLLHTSFSPLIPHEVSDRSSDCYTCIYSRSPIDVSRKGNSWFSLCSPPSQTPFTPAGSHRSHLAGDDFAYQPIFFFVTRTREA